MNGHGLFNQCESILEMWIQFVLIIRGCCWLICRSQMSEHGHRCELEAGIISLHYIQALQEDIHVFLQQIFIEQLLWINHTSRDTSVTKISQNPYANTTYILARILLYSMIITHTHTQMYTHFLQPVTLNELEPEVWEGRERNGMKTNRNRIIEIVCFRTLLPSPSS